MNRLLLFAALVISLQGDLFAQENKQETLTKTQSSFYIVPKRVNHRHWVHLPKDEKMLIEVANDYGLIANLDSLLTIVKRDIAFYKDSLDAAGSVRIDYNFTSVPGISKIRFKKYAPDGDLFINNHTNVARLKIDQDTLCVTVDMPVKRAQTEKLAATQVTFYLNNYTDLDDLLQNKGMLNNIVDTLASVSKPRKGLFASQKSSILYRPFDTSNFSGLNRFKKANVLWNDEKDMYKSHGMLTIDGSLGIGVVRNMLAPMAELGIEVNDRWSIVSGRNSFIRASATPYFFFEKGLGNNITVNDNWFATLEFGTQKDDKRASVGIGYLFAEKGGYFQNTTGKVFAVYTLSKRVSLCPEIIFTNNFRQVYPGVTLRF